MSYLIMDGAFDYYIVIFIFLSLFATSCYMIVVFELDWS